MKKKILFLSIIVLVVGLFIQFNSSNVKADDPIDLTYNENVDLDIVNYGINQHNTHREIMINVNNIAPGKRLTDFLYCLKGDNCTDDANWHSIHSFDPNNRQVTAFENSVGNNDMSFEINVPKEDIYLKAAFTDFEPMNITYALYNGHEYVGDARVLANYGEYKPLITGYMGGDIILPDDCMENGCALKVTLTTANYNAYKSRVDAFNNDLNEDMDEIDFLSLNSMFNHLETVGSDSMIPLYKEYKGGREKNELILDIDQENDTVSFYLFINKYFSENNRADFAVGDNKNRVLAPEYIGLKYKVNRKYFDEGSQYGFTSFTEFNNYEREAVLFYGTPKVKLEVDRLKPIALTATGDASHMGTFKYPYDTIVSGDNNNYPIVNGELVITSFYNPNYTVPLILKNGNTTVKNVTLNLSRFAFGEILVVDADGNNCQDPRVNQNCSESNAYASAEYRGLYDTFYSNGEPQHFDNGVEIIKFQDNHVEVNEIHDMNLIKRDLDFNPWAVAIYYSGDKVVGTKSFDLGSLVKVEGYSEIPLDSNLVNEHLANYNPDNYDVFGYGLGYELPIKDIKWFRAETYKDGNMNYRLILASKKEVEDNNITKIALFLTNGEIKDDEANFPELKYGVGEGKIYEIDHRTFDILGGND